MKIVAIMLISMQALLIGCTSSYSRDPPFDDKCESCSDIARTRDFGFPYEFYVSCGWDSVYRISDPRFGDFSMEYAQDYFDAAWSLNHEGYEPYWGWGIIRMRQADKAGSAHKRIEYLQDALSYMETAQAKKSFDACYSNAIMLDMSRCLLLLGQEHRNAGNLSESKRCAETAKAILDSIVPVGDYEKTRHVDLENVVSNLCANGLDGV